MERRTYLSHLGVLTVGGLAGCAGRRSDGAPETDVPTEGDGTPTDGGTETRSCESGEHLENGSFGCGTKGWTVGRDLPTDPNTGEPVATNVAVTGFGREEPADAPGGSDDDHALELFIDGGQDDGTLWVQQPVDLSGCERLALDVYSESESFNEIAKVAVYAGPERELAEADFDTSRASENHEGWDTYEYAVDHDGDGLVAVGISVVSETEIVRYLDDVRLS